MVELGHLQSTHGLKTIRVSINMKVVKKSYDNEMIEEAVASLQG